MHICYGYGIKANTDWKNRWETNGASTKTRFRAGKSSHRPVSLGECIHSPSCPPACELLAGKDVMVGVIDVASDVVETPEEGG